MPLTKEKQQREQFMQRDLKSSYLSYLSHLILFLQWYAPLSLANR
jgi:hypothetical protein